MKSNTASAYAHVTERSYCAPAGVGDRLHGLMGEVHRPDPRDVEIHKLSEALRQNMQAQADWRGKPKNVVKAWLRRHMPFPVEVVEGKRTVTIPRRTVRVVLWPLPTSWTMTA